jgi:actin-related protein
MFKHVELMRKVAIKIMHKTFGGKSKEANEAIYDAYPLKDLIRLLCFEDADEARTACQHYNITVKNMKVKTSRGTNVEEIIFWKQTTFREPKDPEKGTLIPLSPRKMVKNIESKLGGATRLAVCRGEVSGEGAFLTNISPRKGARYSSPQAAVDNSALAEERAVVLRSMQQREEERRQIDVIKSKEEEDVRLREEELMRDKAEQQQLAEATRIRNIETQERQQLELQRQQEKEEQERILREQQKQELEQRRLEMERESARKKAEEEQKRKLELERQEVLRREQERKLREKEEQRRREAEDQRRQDEMAKRLQAEAEVKRVRQAEEAKRLAELRHREEEERKRRDTLVRREEFEWRKKIDVARKHLLWLRWELQLPRHLRMMEPIEASLRRIDPTVKSGALVEAFANRVALPSNSSLAYQPSKERRIDVRRVVERILGQEPDEINLASSVAMHGAYGALNNDSANSRGNEKTTLLFKIAVVLPVSTNDHVQSLCNLIRTWIDSRLEYDLIRSEYSGDCEIRVVTVDGTLDENLETCDAVMAVICPPWSRPNDGMSTVSESLADMAFRIGNSVPRTVLVLGEGFEQSFIEIRTRSIADIFLGSFDSVSVSSNTDLTEEATEDALLSSCETLTSMLVKATLLRLERISVGRLALKCISDVIWQDRLLERRDDILEHARATLHCMVDEFESLRSDCKTDWQWPAADFAVDGSTIPDYFGAGEDLPLDWISSLSRAELGSAVSTILSALAGPLPEVVERLILGAPYDVKQKIESLLDRRLFRRCLQSALLWNESNQAKQAKYFLYLPTGVLEDTVRSTVVRLQERFVGLLEPSVTDTLADNQTFGSDRTIKSPPSQMPLVPTRAWENSSVLPISKRPRSEPSDPIVDRSLDTRRQETTPPKRRRRDLQTSFQPYSRDQEESLAFSRKLDALLSGSNVQDMMIGDETLSALLRGAPRLARPTKGYLNN